MKRILAMVILLLITAGAGFAQQRSHVVEAGETLFSIARQYEISVDQLRQWNNLAGNDIEIGQQLLISPPVNNGRSDSTVIHRVQPQETLFSISKTYGVSIAEIKTWNNITNNTLEIGRELTIYLPSDSIGTLQQDFGKTESIVTEEYESSNTYYTVKSGDTLYEVAQAHNMTLRELKALNDLTSNTIRVGQRLTVKASQTAPSVSRNTSGKTPQGKFVLHQLEQERTLEGLLQQFAMERDEFRALNPDVEGTRFSAGLKVTVLAPATSTFKNPFLVDAGLETLGKTPVAMYDSSRIGTSTTSGELYNPDNLTAAHRNIELGSVIYVQNQGTQRGIYVRIIDRTSENRLVLSRAAYHALELKPGQADSVNIYQD